MATYEQIETNDQEFPVLGVVSLWFGVALVSITAVSQILLNTESALAESLQFILFALILASGVYIAFRAGQGRFPVAAAPLLINVGTLIIVELVPFPALWEQARFQWNLTAYQQVVNLVETDEIIPDENGYAQLPYRFHRLSENGLIRIDRREATTRIFFFLDAPSPAHVSGYLYRADGRPPQGEFDGQWQVVEPKRPFWYYCAR